MTQKTLTLTFLLAFLYLFSGQSQTKVDHWENIFYYDQPIKYYTGTNAPASNWKLDTYTPDNTWKTGNMSVVGFGPIIQGCTQCPKSDVATTVYSRTLFTIKDAAKIENLVLNLIFMDGIIAYLNGVEIYRSNLGAAGSAVTHTQNADSTLTVDIFNKEFAVATLIEKDKIASCLKNGQNVLAIELHNDAVDVANAAYQLTLYAGLNVPGNDYVISWPEFPFPINADSSEIPIVLLDVPSGRIPDDPKVPATLKIIDNGKGKINHITDVNYSFKGNIKIERRGSSSQDLPKHSYGFKIVDKNGNDTSISLLGMPKENEWILKGEMMDRTLLRDYVTFELARKTNHYVPRSRFCELYFNGKNVGLFAITEKIKRDTFRVDIAKLKNTDNTGLDVTGGYILKLDKTTGSVSEHFTSKYKTLITNSAVLYQLEYPKADDITLEQKAYIKTFMEEFETVLRSDNYKDPDNGYRKYISVKSFIDYLISQELGRNIDGYRLSTFMYKEKDKADKLGKLHMGPLWDFNLAYGYSGSLCGGGWAREGWAFDYNDDCPGDSYYIPFWWDRLHQDPAFRSELKARWDELRKGPLHIDSINALIDTTVDVNNNAIDRNFQIWHNVFLSSIYFNGVVGQNYNEEISYMKTFISERLDWLDANLPSIREEVVYPVGINSINTNISQIRVYPVPFNTEVTFEFAASNNNKVKLSIFNLSGQSIYTANGFTTEGLNYLKWNGNDGAGKNVKSGIYVYTLELDGQIIVRNKIVKN